MRNVPGVFSYKAGRCGSSPPWGGGYLVEQLVVCKTAHRQLCALTGVGEGKEGAVHAQRQHAVDIQSGLTELGAEHEGVHALSLQLLQVAQTAGKDSSLSRHCHNIPAIGNRGLVGPCPGNGQGDSRAAAVALGCAAAGADAIHKVVAQCITDDLFVGLALMGGAGVDPLARSGAGGLYRSRQLVAVAVLLDADQVTCDGNAAVLVFGGGGVFRRY